MKRFLMRHNPFAVMLSPDSGDGQGGGSSTDGAKPAADDQGSKTPATDESKKPTEDSLPKTKAELEALLQSEGDKRITSYLNGEKFKTSVSEIVNRSLEEERKLQKMTLEERKKADEEKRLKELDERDATIAEKERQLKVVDLLSIEKAPAKLRPYITAKDEAGMREQLNELLSIIDEGVAAKAQDKLAAAAIDLNGHGDTKGTAVKSSGDAVLDALGRATKKE